MDHLRYVNQTRNMLFLLLVVMSWFWPRYDLQILTSHPSKTLKVVEKNFHTLDACHGAGGEYGSARSYTCLKHTIWGSWFNDFSKYDAKHP